MKKKNKRNKKISALAVSSMLMTTMLAFLVLGGIGNAGDTSGWIQSSTNVILSTQTDSVGIGTSTPSEKLEVVGTVQMTGFKMTTFPTTGYVLTSDQYGVGTWQPLPPFIDGGGSTNYIAKFADSDTLTTSIIYETSGKIGIGTTSPGEKLHVNGNIHASGTIKSGNSITIDGDNDKITATSGEISFDNEDLVTTGEITAAKIDISGKIVVGDDGTAATSGTIKFDGSNFKGWDGSSWQTLDVQAPSGGGWTQGSGVVRLITATDQVGIGTTSPKSELTIYDTGDGDTDPALTWDVSGSNDWYMGIDNSHDQRLKIGKGSSVGSDTRLTIETAGNVGIGTSDPQVKLHVNGGDVRLSGGYGVQFVDANTEIREASNNLYIEADNNLNLNPDNDVKISMGATYYAIFEGSTERFGIGTTDPNARLDVVVGMDDGGAATIGDSGCDATGRYSIAMGEDSVALGRTGIAMGREARAETSYSIAIGDHVEVDSSTGNGYASMALGRYMRVRGDYSIGIGLSFNTLSTITDDHVLAIMGGDVGIGTISPQNVLHLVDYNAPPLRYDCTGTASSKTFADYYIPISVDGTTYYLKLYD
jgi:hypothetical protein